MSDFDEFMIKKRIQNGKETIFTKQVSSGEI